MALCKSQGRRPTLAGENTALLSLIMAWIEVLGNFVFGEDMGFLAYVIVTWTHSLMLHMLLGVREKPWCFISPDCLRYPGWFELGSKVLTFVHWLEFSKWSVYIRSFSFSFSFHYGEEIHEKHCPITLNFYNIHQIFKKTCIIFWLLTMFL